MMDHHDERRAAAVARITDKRDFKNHAVVYCAVNTLLVIIWAASGAGSFWPIWVIAGWGMGLAAHAWRVYGQKPISEADIIEEMQRGQNPPNRTPSKLEHGAREGADARMRAQSATTTPPAVSRSRRQR